jgi:hypothetical protein
LHAKRSIEHIVILIGRVDNHARDNGDSIIYAFSRNFQDWVASARGKEIYLAHLVLPPRHASVAILLRKVISFFSLSVSFASLHFPSSLPFFHFALSCDRYTSDETRQPTSDRARETRVDGVFDQAITLGIMNYYNL